MDAHHDVVQGGGLTVVFGWVVSGYSWLTGGMAPITVIATVLTIALTWLKLRDYIRSRRGPKFPELPED